jgi:hypothetical protein
LACGVWVSTCSSLNTYIMTRCPCVFLVTLIYHSGEDRDLWQGKYALSYRQRRVFLQQLRVLLLRSLMR